MAAAGWKMIRPRVDGGSVPCGILFSVRESDLPELPALARKFYELGFELYATTGNAATIERSGMPVSHVAKVHEDYHDNVMTLLESGKIAYVVSTSAKGRDPVAESVKLRRLAVERDIDCLTAVDTANALADCLAGPYTLDNVGLVNVNCMGETVSKVLGNVLPRTL
jgi:carbamoyl-phosphate synthase large subunit